MKFKEYLKEITIIDFSKSLSDFENVKDLPEDIQKFLYREVDNFQSSGFQEVMGYNKNKIVISLGGYWKEKNNKFYINSWGINKGYKPKEVEVKNYQGKL